MELQTTAVYRDTSAWYHIVLAIDTTQSTSTNRTKLYVNGDQVTTFSTANYPAQNSTLQYLYQNANNGIGAANQYGGYFDGYLADCYVIDGQALTPSSFTEVSATTGQLIPKAYSGSFGTNGFWLKFSDNSAATAAALGNDYSGNNNDWTPNNLSVTAGAGNDSLVDTPTSGSTVDTGLGGQVTGNYCTWNPLEKAANATLANGNLDISQSSGDQNTGATIAVGSGKWYWEVTFASGSEARVGAIKQQFVKTDSPFSAFLGGGSNGYSYANGGYKSNANSNSATGYSSYTTGDVVSVALDLDNGRIFFAKNGTWQESGNPATGANPAYTGLSGTFTAAVYTPNATLNANFGQRAFAYTAPSGFKALCDTNLPAPLTAKPNTVMDVKLYTGTGSAQTISGLGFSPDLVWVKDRSATNYHTLQDIVRGATKDLYSNVTDAEGTQAQSINAFNSDGFSVGTAGWVNASSNSYVSWAWDAGTSTVSNTSGSITSQVRANPTAGFSVVTYSTGASSGNQTIGHGLNVTPSLIIHKVYSTTSNWWVYHASTTNTVSKYLQLNSTNATADNILSMWGAALPTSTVFGANVGQLLQSNQSAVAYCFAPVVGYSSFGSYVGSGTSDGPFVYTGFRPRWVMIKSSSFAGGNWLIVDSARSTYNVVTTALAAEGADSEASLSLPLGVMDILSNGFKLKYQYDSSNKSSVTYIYAAFAENPFQYARAR